MSINCPLPGFDIDGKKLSVDNCMRNLRTPNNTILVVAGNVSQADYIMKSLCYPALSWRYIFEDDLNQLFGRKEIILFLLGTFYQRNDLAEILREAKRRNAAIIEISEQFEYIRDSRYA